jgi:hypothetical protein
MSKLTGSDVLATYIWVNDGARSLCDLRAAATVPRGVAAPFFASVSRAWAGLCRGPDHRGVP